MLPTAPSVCGTTKASAIAANDATAIRNFDMRAGLVIDRSKTSRAVLAYLTEMFDEYEHLSKDSFFFRKHQRDWGNVRLQRLEKGRLRLGRLRQRVVKLA